MQIHFTVPTVPVAQPRQRHRLVKSGDRQFVVNYTPSTHPANACKATIRQSFQACYDGPPLMGPLGLEVVAVFPRPRAMTWAKKPMPRVWYWSSRCDADNVLKTVMDALTGLAWSDDGHVARAVIERKIAAGDEQAHLEITITDLGGRAG